MDGSRVRRLKDKLDVEDWKEIDQKKFNDLVTNLNGLDQETVRSVIANIPNLSEKVLTYFNQMNEHFNVNNKDYIDALSEQQKLFKELLKDENDPAMRMKIADELLEHSKWLRREATITRIFKMVMGAIGAGVAFLFVKAITNGIDYNHSFAKIPIRSATIGPLTYGHDENGQSFARIEPTSRYEREGSNYESTLSSHRLQDRQENRLGISLSARENSSKTLPAWSLDKIEMKLSSKEREMSF